jgi:hypothetical protein
MRTCIAPYSTASVYVDVAELLGALDESEMAALRKRAREIARRRDKS